MIVRLARGTTYEIRVRAKNPNGVSDWNATTEVTTRARVQRHSSLVESAFAADTDQVWLILLTIDHTTLPEPIRVVNNLEDIDSRGDTYTACPFAISLPNQSEGGVPEARIRLENISQRMIRIIRTVDSELFVTIEIVRAEAPNTVEQSFEDFALKSVSADATTIEGVLGLSDTILTAIPIYTFSPSFFPGLFRG